MESSRLTLFNRFLMPAYHNMYVCLVLRNRINPTDLLDMFSFFYSNKKKEVLSDLESVVTMINALVP